MGYEIISCDIDLNAPVSKYAKLGIITSSSFEILNVFKAEISYALILQVNTTKSSPK
tara:strand:+ start:376 stop:546 length:171 start_codon:yes stop_codon:yes gene_type:complete